MKITKGVDVQRFAQNPQWIARLVEGDIWHGAGDETKLEHILDTFLKWAEASDA